jgi:hypothetical protein
MGSLNWRAKNPAVPGVDSNPLLPPPPQPAYYDSFRNAWVLSRYADVFAALHEPRLWPVDSRAESPPEQAALDAQRRLRTETMIVLSRQNIESWRNQFVALAHTTMANLPSETRVDILKHFAEPWCRAVTITVTRTDARDSARLFAFARTASLAVADPSDRCLRYAAKAANLQLVKSLDSSPVPMSGPTFVALSQTLPRFLANAWLALLRHPRQLDRLRAEPDLISSAVEELLRYAGLSPMLFRSPGHPHAIFRKSRSNPLPRPRPSGYLTVVWPATRAWPRSALLRRSLTHQNGRRDRHCCFGRKCRCRRYRESRRMGRRIWLSFRKFPVCSPASAALNRALPRKPTLRAFHPCLVRHAER